MRLSRSLRLRLVLKSSRSASSHSSIRIWRRRPRRIGLSFVPVWQRPMRRYSLRQSTIVRYRPFSRMRSTSGRGPTAKDGIPAAVASVSFGAIGGFGANHHLRQSLTYVNMPTLQQPEVYISNASGLFDEAGKLNDGTRDLLKNFVTTFAAWIEKTRQG